MVDTVSMDDEEKRRLQIRKRRLEIGAIVVLGVVIPILILIIPPSRMTEPTVKLLTVLVWPYFILMIVVVFRSQVITFVATINQRIASGGGIEFGWVKLPEVAKVAEQIPAPQSAQPVTLKNIALLHTSFLSQKETNRIADGRIYYQFEVIVIAPKPVMDLVENVTYFLDDMWPPYLRVRSTKDGSSRFKMKDLANGTSIVRAEVRIRGEQEPLHLNRFIDLQSNGPRI